MEKLTVYSELFPEKRRDYTGVNIYAVTALRRERGKTWYRLSNGVWIREDKRGEFFSDWTREETWGRVEKTEYDEVTGEERRAGTVGFIILSISRSSGRVY